MRKILNLTLILFAVTLISCYTAWRLGYQGFLLPDTEIPKWVGDIIGWFACVIQFYIMSAVILNDYTKRQVIITLIASPVFALLFYIIAVLQSHELQTAVTFGIPTSYFIIYSIIHKSFKKSMLRMLVFYVLLSAVQALLLLLKTGFFNITVHNLRSTYEIIILNIDLMIFFAVAYCAGGIKYFKNREAIFPEAIETADDSPEFEEVKNAVMNLKGFKKVLAYTFLLGTSIVQYFIVLFTIYLFDAVLVEALIISLSFIIYGFIIQRRWHSKSVIICTLLSTALFYLAAKLYSLTIGFNISQFLPIVIGLLLVYAMYRIRLIADSNEKPITNTEKSGVD